ncbi:hypothetical protein RU639_008987 [Aspergillus parasiticus]
MSKHNFETLVDLMKAHDSTRGWDVVVAYDEDKINALLAKQHLPAFNSLSDFQGTSPGEYNPYTGEVEDQTYRFQSELKNNKSRLRFQSEESSRAEIVVDVPAMTCQFLGAKDPKKTERASRCGFLIKVKVDLLNMEGTVKEEETKGTVFIPNTTAKNSPLITKSNYVTPVSTGRGVCISFAAPIVELEANNSDKTTPIFHAAGDRAIKNALQEIFTSDQNNHFLSGVQSVTTNPDTIPLKPVSFAFTTVKGDEPKKLPGALMMWISVEGGQNRGLRPSGQTDLRFDPDPSKPAPNPIPEGSSATVILSHDLVANAFFKPNLETALSDVQIDSKVGDPGMIISGQLKGDDVDVEIDTENVPYIVTTIDHVKFALKNPRTTVTLNPGIVNPDAITTNPPVRLQYSKTMEVGVIRTVTSPRSGLSPNVTTTVAKNSSTWAWGATGVWKGKANSTEKSQHSNYLRLDFAQDEKWKIRTVPSDNKGDWNPFAVQHNFVPEGWSKVNPPVPKLDLKMKALDYFLTTNLLLPGKHVFNAHNPSDATKATGLAVPRDLILTGDVNLDA